ncbi:rod shape-determining protein MreD [Vagococcus sp. JNUCC 83]
MAKKSYYPYYLPVILFIAMLVDGHVSSAMMGMLSIPMTFTSHLVLLILMFSTFKVSQSYLMICATVVGLLYDSYFYNVLGINLILLPLIVFLMYRLFDYVKPNTLTLILSFIVFVTLIAIGRAVLLTVFKLTNATFLDFFTRNLAPSLLVNTLYICLLVIPLSRVYRINEIK